MTESNGPLEEKTVEGKPVEAAQSTTATVAHPLARDLYDWASRLASEAGNEVEDYYWTPQMERLVTKLKLTKRALVGVVGVQGVGKTATMRAIQAELVGRGFDRDHVIALKVPESGGLTTALKTAFNPPDADGSRLDDLLSEEMAYRLFHDSILQRRVRSRANHAGDTELAEKVGKVTATFDETDVMKLRTVIPQRIVREVEGEALRCLLESQKVIMIDMPDYPKHDRRLIMRDLDDLQGIWNRLMASDKDVSLVIFIQKETFNHADHFLYGKMDLIDLLPLTTSQLLEAYARKWSGYAPFNEDALQYVAKMSRGVFRRFKRYIALAVEAWVAPRLGKSIPGHLDIEYAMTQEGQPESPIDLALVEGAVTDEEVMRDMDKELDGIFKNRAQKELALAIIRYLSLPQLKNGVNQKSIAHDRQIEEMTVSRLIRELEQHGYVKRTSRPIPAFGGEEKIVQMNW